MLMRETSKLFGDETEALCPFMAALEMIHTYSLVHDDLPAMDNDEYRRGRKTTHIVYGEEMCIRDSLRSLFPEKRIAFQEVISEILTGDLKSSVKLLTEFAGEQMLYLLQTGKKNLVHILLIAMIAAFMNQLSLIHIYRDT